MISAFSGTIWTAMIITMKAARPRKRNFASASAARNASTSESATTDGDDDQAVPDVVPEVGRLIASREVRRASRAREPLRRVARGCRRPA